MEVGDITHPSSTAVPNGLVLLLPPKKRFQIVSANDDAWASDWNPTLPVAPPRERVMIFPFAWHVAMSEARAWQLARAVPGNVALSTELQVYAQS